MFLTSISHECEFFHFYLLWCAFQKPFKQHPQITKNLIKSPKYKVKPLDLSQVSVGSCINVHQICEKVY